MTIAFRKVSEEHGWMGNMSAFPVEYEGKVYRTTEALFQALRFDDETIIEEIREQKSPMSAKMKAKKNKDKMVVKQLSEQDLDLMRLCVRLKIEQHDDLRDKLIATGDELIVEDVTKRRNKGSAMFWGAALELDTLEEEGVEVWTGQNWLGKIWAELREKVINAL
ncbi:MAG: NADAR family protein [Candidatus Thorarchaeota archaeon]|jgi:ribA/ribD-fused uncharacterized protein